MTLAMSLQFPATPPITGHTTSSSLRKTTAVRYHCPFQARFPKITDKRRIRRKQSFWATKAVDESRGNSEPEVANESESKGELSELGSEIKKAMEERKAAEKEEGEGLLGGVSKEIREIEWPSFGKVLGTTWVVLGVIAGSSVVLLTLNAVLAELSDRVFAGRGFQDFFT
ncbi:Preprotein translocase subunit SECE1 [Morus notabilis]|uniref:Preprotein translocase subunit SECE1 n=1 Tax=Morus notabilis TaxID=981085 RepID=W9RPA1_9ROSA|nr:preprotein translocase subunit SECE1 [Morus notabilis]EXB63453.1 Preprotein translocase subunit SECE1 [Morus notabilis]